MVADGKKTSGIVRLGEFRLMLDLLSKGWMIGLFSAVPDPLGILA